MWRYLDRSALRLTFSRVHRGRSEDEWADLGVFSLCVREGSGNCSHVEVDLNSLKRLEKETRMTIPEELTASKWRTKYLVWSGLKMV